MDFKDLQVDPIVGAEIMQQLGLNTDDLNNNTKFARLQDVIKYLGPMEDRRHVISKLTLAKNVDKLDHVWSYINLRKELTGVEATYNKARSEIDALANNVEQIKSELALYEK